MYQALYRKYRPSTFDDVVGQDVIVKTLKNEITHNKLSHAYLFTGPRGTGKTSVAKILAKTVNCTNLNGFIPCDECVSCTQINNKQTTDIIEIDAASNNGVDEIRELKSKVNLVPASSKYKVYIIDEVHMLTVGAFNALLKTLEEPPSHIIFILATTDPHKIPTTILSRCQRFDFKKISENNLVQRLHYIVEQENIKIDQDALLEIARLSDGGMRDSISMLDQVISYVEDNQTITVKDVHDVNGTLTQKEIQFLVKSLIHKNIQELFEMIDQCNDSGKNLVKLTEEIILFLRNLLLSKVVPKYFENNQMNLPIYLELKDQIESENLLGMIHEFNLALNDMKLSNNPKMILELSIIKQLNSEKKLINVSDTQKENSLKKHEKKALNDDQNEKTTIELKTKRSSTLNLSSDSSNSEIKNEVSSKTTIKYFPGKVFDETKIEELKKLKAIRINNALASFNKRELLEFKKQSELLHTYLLDADYSEWVSMILDGTLKAIGNDYLVYVFPNERLSEIFNQSLINIDAVLEKVFHKKYHAISTDINEWDKIKNEFNNKTKKYEYEEETIDLNDLFKDEEENDKNEIESLFGDLVHYE